MKPKVINNILESALRSKFRGCLFGTLVGDCLGKPFEGESMSSGSKIVLKKYMDTLFGDIFDPHKVKHYSDDTAMTMCVAQSLIDNKGFNLKDLAIKFVKTYYQHPNIGYGDAVPLVFEKLRKQKFKGDLFQPAEAQFEGCGSYGNGGAMRVSPIALFHFNDKTVDRMLETVTDVTRLTHSNENAINGARLHCLAIRKCLRSDLNHKLDCHQFIDELEQEFFQFENDESEKDFGIITSFEQKPYLAQLKEIKNFLKTTKPVEDEHVIQILGNNVSALYSVPTAIYCFLRAYSSIDQIETDNPVRRTLHYAISLGGDTDTIANMAGSLAGAYYGDSYLNGTIQNYCQASNDVLTLADKLYNLVMNKD